MKAKIKIADLERAGRSAENLAALRSAGSVQGDWLILEHDDLVRIEKQFMPDRVHGQNIIPHGREALDHLIDSRQEVCARCEWNIEELCQHPGCAKCAGQQARTGRLLAFIKIPTSRCPIKKWR